MIRKEDLPKDIVDKIPTFYCEEWHGQWRFKCPYCKVWHHHGPGAGHRVAHCGDKYENGKLIRARRDSPYGFSGYFIELKELKKE